MYWYVWMVEVMEMMLCWLVRVDSGACEAGWPIQNLTVKRLVLVAL